MSDQSQDAGRDSIDRAMAAEAAAPAVDREDLDLHDPRGNTGRAMVQGFHNPDRDRVDALRVKVNPETLLKVLPFAALNDIRYYLNGVRIERTGRRGEPGIVAVACDGHTLAAALDPVGMIVGASAVTLRVSPGLAAAMKECWRAKCGGTRVKGGAVLKGLAQVLVKGRRLSLAVDYGQEATDSEAYVQAGDSLVPGQFPNWRRVVPKFDRLVPHHIGHLKPGYLTRLAAVQAFAEHPLTRKGHTSVMAWQPLPPDSEIVDHQAGVVFQLDHMPEFMALIMTMRGEAESTAAWKAGFQRVLAV